MDVDQQKEELVLYGSIEAIRGRTLKLLKNATDDELLWTPPGLTNHLLWHAGHSLWLQDLLCIEAATGASELPESWHEAFSMHCRPVSQTHTWPARLEVRDRLTQQLDRLLEVVGSLTAEDLRGPPRCDSLPDAEPLRYWICHGLHDEANHQGEMHLLLKMQRAGKV